MAKNGSPVFLKFCGHQYSVSELETAFAKSSVSNIDANAEFHPEEFEPFPAERLEGGKIEKMHLPIVTIHEGKYVFIYKPDGFVPTLSKVVDKKVEKIVVDKAFKAKFVTKYNFNKTKYVKPPVVNVHAPLPNSEYSQPNRPYQSRPPYGGYQNQNGGYQNNFRRDDGRNN